MVWIKIVYGTKWTEINKNHKRSHTKGKPLSQSCIFSVSTFICINIIWKFEVSWWKYKTTVFIYKSTNILFIYYVKVFLVNDTHNHTCTHTLAYFAVNEAVGTRSHLHKLARVINDVALNSADRHFWEPLFIHHWSIMAAFEGWSVQDRGCPLSAVWRGGETSPPLANDTFGSILP